MARVVIIGAGIVGLSVARAALKRGHAVHLLEQGEVPNPHSASYDRHRMIRYHYGAALGYTRMVAPAFEAWSRVWEDIGSEEFEDTGAISISLEAGDYAAKTLEAFREIRIRHEVLDRDGVERLCPHLQLPEGAWGVTASPGGPLFAGRIVTGLARWVTEHGAVVEGGCRIARVDQERGVAVRADGSAVEGDMLVIAAGAWLPALMPQHYGEAATWRQGLCYIEPPARFTQSWRDAPAIVTLGDHAGYTLPDRRGAGLKFGHGPHRRRARPEVDGFGSDLAAEGEAILAPFRPYLRDAEAYRPTRIQVGYYVLDPSRRFRLDKAGRGLVVTNCDGQMFKFGPLLGERIMAMFDGAESASDLARWAAGY